MKITIIALLLIIFYEEREKKKLKNNIRILQTEKFYNRKVMYENGLIPRSFVHDEATKYEKFNP